MNELLLSIVIPVYNTEKLIPECLDSILEQDFDKNRYEIVCVDDGSTDNSGEIIDEYAEKYNNIKVIHKKNEGVSTARYIGVNNASGKYVWFVDSDDFIDVNSFNIIEKALIDNEFPDHLYFCFKNAPWNGKESMEELIKKIYSFKTMHTEATLWTSVYNIDLLNKYNIPKICYEKNLSFAEDALFNFYVRCHENSLVRINDALYFYRNNPESVTSQKNLKKEIKRAHNYIVVASSIKKVLDNFSQETYTCKKSYVAEHFMNIIWILMELLASLPIIHRHKLVNQAKKEKAFPAEIPEDYIVSPENTMKWAYGKNKVEKYLNCHCNSRLGFFLLTVYYTPVRIKTALKRIISK